jgi:hypothetical protein
MRQTGGRGETRALEEEVVVELLALLRGDLARALVAVDDLLDTRGNDSETQLAHGRRRVPK